MNNVQVNGEGDFQEIDGRQMAVTWRALLASSEQRAAEYRRNCHYLRGTARRGAAPHIRRVPPPRLGRALCDCGNEEEKVRSGLKISYCSSRYAATYFLILPPRAGIFLLIPASIVGRITPAEGCS